MIHTGSAPLSLRDSGHGDAIELISAQTVPALPPVSRAILHRTHVLDKSQAPHPEVRPEPCRIEPERPRLADPLEPPEVTWGAVERFGLGQHLPVDVGENDHASRRRRSEPTKARVDGGVSEIVGDALPEEARARPGIVPALSHGRGQLTLVEIRLDEAHMTRSRGQHHSKAPPLLRERSRLVDLEHANPLHPG